MEAPHARTCHVLVSHFRCTRITTTSSIVNIWHTSVINVVSQRVHVKHVRWMQCDGMG